MAVAQRYITQQSSNRGGPSGLADVLEVLLDKGLVIDAFVRVSLVGIELLTVDARVVVASVDTYLRFAEAVNRLDLLQASNSQTLGDLIGRPSRRSQNGDRPGGEGQDDGAGRRDRHERQPAEIGAGRSSGDREKSRGGESGRAEQGGGEQEESSSEGGLLSRIKQRGQAF